MSIKYDQAANFPVYRVNVGDEPVATAGALFIMYRITSIKNPTGVPFTFDKHKVLVGQPGKTRNEEPAGDSQLLGDKLLGTIEVAAGKEAKDPGCIIKLVDAAGDPTKQGTELIPASYEKQSLSTSMQRASDDNVTTLVTQATSITLRNFCRA